MKTLCLLAAAAVACAPSSRYIGGAPSTLELRQEKERGASREYAVTVGEARAVVMESLSQAGWAPEQSPEGYVVVHVHDDKYGPGTALIWCDQRTPASTAVTVRSGTAVIVDGQHPLFEPNLLGRIGGAIQAYLARKAVARR